MNCQINMKINSMQSDLLEVVSLVGEELGRWEERKQRHLQLLEALLGLTQKAPSQAEEGFTTQELRDEVSRIINKPWGNDENQAKVVSQHWSKLEAVWDKKREGLRQRAAAQNLAGFPVLRKTTGGGGGLPSRYAFIVQAFEDDDLAESHPPPEESGSVQYFLDDLEPGNWLVSAFANQVELAGWRKWAFIGLLFAALLAVLIFGLAAFFSLSHVPQTGPVVALVLSVAALSALVWHGVKPFVEILDFKTAIAPGWLQNAGSAEDRLLVFERRMPDAPNSIRIVRYSATCPLCGGRVRLTDGRKQFPRRIIGRCDASPREHVFSFDHHCRTGYRLLG
ncbi:MAG: hypothetical protein KC777_10810 [Cyanobacteria bacterium HKST-UBA02]|nr:hypothetical protein [Cyanobacteria bacterium HKST-UBA02]